MKIFFYFAFLLLAANCLKAKEVSIALEDCVLIKSAVPDRGIVCSNAERVMRLSQFLQNPKMITSSWGPFVITGTYRDKEVFIALAPIGSGSGLLFTELYAAGARYILRYGSEDAIQACDAETTLIKIIDEADNLYGFEMQNGIDPSSWGKSISASKEIVDTIEKLAQQRGFISEKRLCHHLENYHSLRSTQKYLGERGDRIRRNLQELQNSDKPCSFDMESAVLFRIAKDFGLHAATVLQTVNKQSKTELPYRGSNRAQALDVEEKVFARLVFDVLLDLD